MRNLDLNAYGVSEMNAVEMQTVDGGSLLLALAVCAIVAVVASSCATTRIAVKSNGAIQYEAANDSVQ
jgi:lactobin A/cerein 7B family class IIb bacteriocin